MCIRDRSKTVYRALTIIMLGMVAALGSAVVVYYNTSDAVTVIDAIFESCSAFGTVGLSAVSYTHLQQEDRHSRYLQEHEKSRSIFPASHVGDRDGIEEGVGR